MVGQHLKQPLSIPWKVKGITFKKSKPYKLRVCNSCKGDKIFQKYKNGLCEDCSKMENILSIFGKVEKC